MLVTLFLVNNSISFKRIPLILILNCYFSSLMTIFLWCLLDSCSVVLMMLSYGEGPKKLVSICNGNPIAAIYLIYITGIFAWIKNNCFWQKENEFNSSYLKASMLMRCAAHHLALWTGNHGVRNSTGIILLCHVCLSNLPENLRFPTEIPCKGMRRMRRVYLLHPSGTIFTKLRT